MVRVRVCWSFFFRPQFFPFRVFFFFFLISPVVLFARRLRRRRLCLRPYPRCPVRSLCLTVKFSAIDVRRNAVVWSYLRRSNAAPVTRVRKSRSVL